MGKPLPDEVRALLDHFERRLPDGDVREVSMFGMTAVMLDDTMVVAVGKDGSVLVRVDRAEDAGLLERPDAIRPEMGAGRSMGAGWIRADPADEWADATLDFWLQAGLRGWKSAITGR